MEIRITKHGSKRLKERIDIDRLLKKEVKCAWNDGALPSDEEVESLLFLLDGKAKDNSWMREFRKYNGHLYCFARTNKSDILLITVI